MEFNLTDIKIKGLEACVALTQEKTDVKVSLKDITVLDPTHGTVYPKVGINNFFYEVVILTP
jgi:hypothetical protein